MTTTISRTQLARQTRQVVEQVRRSGGVIVESFGEEQVAILDVQDYRLLLAMAAYRSLPPKETPVNEPSQTPAGLTEDVLSEEGGSLQQRWNQVIAAYLDGEISLGRAALLLGISRYELLERCHRFNIPLPVGPQPIEEAIADFAALQP